MAGLSVISICLLLGVCYGMKTEVEESLLHVKQHLPDTDSSLSNKVELLIKTVDELKSRDNANQQEIRMLNSKMALRDLENQNLIGTLKQKVASLEANDVENKKEIKALKSKVLLLETQEAVDKDVITAMENKMSSFEHVFKLTEQNLVTTISKLQSELEKFGIEGSVLQSLNLSTHDKDVVSHLESRGNPEMKDRNQRKHAERFTELRRRRGVPEVDVAFYATVTPHDVLHLGTHQNIVFDNSVTNLGNAYHNVHGIFTAPVDGTYIFFVTLSSETANQSSRYYAYVDVNGVDRANLLMTAYEQSSQTVIVQLKAGNDVSIRNSVTGENLLGAHYSTFAGFLLFQDFSGSQGIVG